MNELQPVNWTLAAWAIGMGVLTLGGMLALMPRLIGYLRRLKFGQTEREEGLASHQAKTGTPTMGGLAFTVIPFAVYAIFTLFSPLKWTFTAGMLWTAYLGFGLIGAVDDYLIVVRHSNVGLKPWLKLGLQVALAVVLTVFYMKEETITIYLMNGFTWTLPGWLFFCLIVFMFAGTTNAVNLSDGVDGLCAGLCSITLIPFICYMVWQGNSEGAAILLMVIFALIGYLRFNLHPAKVFMGDTGSLALGGLLACAALMTQMEVFLIVAGVVFIAETLSDIIQVLHYKRTHRRVFLMAPLHHHFEKKGWSENKVDLVFWLYDAFFAIIAIWLGSMV